MKRILTAVSIAAILLMALITTSCGNGDDNGNDSGSKTTFTITSPYEGIVWDTFGQYKAALHVHTTNSDGGQSMLDVVNAHYAKDFDILAITDHIWKGQEGARPYLNYINRGWTEESWTVGGVTTPLSRITQERLDEVTQGEGRDGKIMLAIPNTAELALDPGGEEVNVFFHTAAVSNAWSLKIHFALEDAQKSNAISFINHPGRITGGMAGGQQGAAASNDPKNIEKYADLFMEFSNCAGFEIFNREDNESRSDRILWDNVNTRTIPQGRVVYGYGNDDSHSQGNIDVNANIFVMQSNTLENFKNAMLKGQSYAIARVARREGVGMNTAGTNPDINTSVPRPVIKNISVNKEEASITITAEHATKIVWISEGKEIYTANSSSSTLPLTVTGLQIGCYVRANIIGPGGIAVTQPFVVKKN